MKIEIEVSELNESTRSPWWAIVDPRQNFHTGYDGVHNIASMITGPFFSRESAEKHLLMRRYAFGKSAKVFCFSGTWSSDYENAIKKAKKTYQTTQRMAPDNKG